MGGGLAKNVAEITGENVDVATREGKPKISLVTAKTGDSKGIFGSGKGEGEGE